MNIGKLYEIKEYFWLLYPSKEIAYAADDATAGRATLVHATAMATAAYYRKRFKCNVSYIEPNSIFMLLDQDGEYIKILSTNGELGWIYLADWCKKDIEEVEAE